MQAFTARVLEVIKTIPPGQVMTYGQVAAWAGNHRAARQVSRFLNTYGKSHELPWHRVVNAQGKIAIPVGKGYEKQYQLLLQEGITFGIGEQIDLSVYARKD